MTLNSFIGKNFSSRGIRNNNIGNIIINSSNNWKGKIKGTDLQFETFSKVEFGIRALYVLINNYHKQGFNTITKIIGKYSPPNENKTNLYINHVSKKLNLGVNVILNPKDKNTLIELAKAISSMENKSSELHLLTDSMFLNAYEIFKNPTLVSIDNLSDTLTEKCPHCGKILGVIVFFYSFFTYIILTN